MALWLPKWMRDEEAPPEDSSRRTFIFMGAAAGIALVSEPVQLFDWGDMPKVPLPGARLSLEEMNRIIRELYTPMVAKNLNDNRVLLKYSRREDPVCPYCEEGIATNMAYCPRCRATLYRKDFSLPEDLVDDMSFFRKMAEES